MLLDYDPETGQWTPKSHLTAASSSSAGSYRRVNKEVWDLYAQWYPESGPAITVVGSRPPPVT